MVATLWIGLGNMGRGMCKNIVEKANLDGPLMIYNRSIQRAEALSQALPSGKTEIVESISAGAAKADAIFMCLANDTVVEATIEEIFKAGGVSGKLIVDCSTVHPDLSDRLGKLIVEKGGDFVAAPVFGAPAMADSGMLIGVLAGPAKAIARARPYFKGVTSRVDIEMADEPYHKSSQLKLIGNSFILNMVEQLAEGHVLAEKTGLGTAPLTQWIEAMFPGPYTAYSHRMLSGDYHTRAEPLFAVDIAMKDANHMRSMAKEAGMTLPNIETALAHLVQVKEHTGPSADFAAIYGAVRQEAGLKFEN